MNAFAIANLASVGIFGIILSARFCDIVWTRKKISIIAGSAAVIMLLQGIVFMAYGSYTVKHLYPVIAHVPLLIVLCILNRSLLWPLISVFATYLCCQMRRWLALLVVALFSGSLLVQLDIAELVITLPLLILLLRFIAPSVRSISNYTASEKCWFGLVPALYYIFDYGALVYTSLYSDGNPVAVEFMPFVCSIAYLIFVLRVSGDGRIRIQLEQTQNTLNIQVTQAVREIALLRESQRKTRTYRHDLRHHMQHILSYIENERFEHARTYIQEICSEIEAAKVTVFCENEAANLIFSAFAIRAANKGIPINIRAEIPCRIRVSEGDLCVLLSNALENAMNSCQFLVENGEPASIDVSSYEKNGRIFIQVVNSCEDGVVFSNGIPVTSKLGHGIGTQSICAIVECYGGIYTFAAKDGQFVMRVSL